MSEIEEEHNRKEEEKGDERQEESPKHVCSSEGCNKEANMACPTCIKIGLPPTRFCSQECFKNNWGVHKALHKAVKKARLEAKGDPTLIPKEFQGYYFTGPLRPAGKSPRRPVPKHIPRPDYADHPEGHPVSEIQDKRNNNSIRIYTPEEIEGIREACRIGREVLDAGAAAIRVGVTCDEIDRVVHEATIERNAYPSPLNYYKFPKSLCTSVNEVICHGIPDMRELEDGDIVNLDISVYYNGYHADLNETFFVGNVDSEGRKLVEVAYNCLRAAINIARPGTLYRDFGKEINKVAAQSKCTVVTTYCGHGIGTLFHTAPNVPHYAKNKAKGVLKVGHVFTIEPMINLGKHRDCLWPDGWTAVTEDGSRSAQFEHTMVVTETGVELLTARLGQPTDRIEWDAEYFQR